jgi:hypothetical protein
MKRELLGLAALPLLATAALAQPAPLASKQPLQLSHKQPVQLSDVQMDKISAGFLEIDTSNTSFTILSLFFSPFLLNSTPNTITCSDCYLLINSPFFSIGSVFGQPLTPPTAPP